MRRITVDGQRRRRTAGCRATGYDPAYGARPLRRLVQTAIGDPLARLLLGGEVLDGSAVTVDVAASGDGLVLTTPCHHSLTPDSPDGLAVRAGLDSSSVTDYPGVGRQRPDLLHAPRADLAAAVEHRGPELRPTAPS